MRDYVLLRLEHPSFDPSRVEVAELSGRETLSRLFEFELRVVSLDDLDDEALLTKPATLVFERRDADGDKPTEVRRLPGMIRSVVDRALTESRHREYIVSMVPRVWQATLFSTTDVCMDMTVPEIIQKKLKEGAALESGTDLELRLTRSYPKKEFIVQYKETNLDFCCRLAEDLGIFFTFEESNGRDLMVFGDENSSFKPSVPEKAPFRARGEHVDIYQLESRAQIVPQQFVTRDYNYRNPSMDVHGEAKVPGSATMGTIDEYGPHAKTPDEATYYATVRAQEAASRRLTFEGWSELPGLRAGSVVTIEGHPRGDMELVVTEVVHEAAQSVFGQAAAREVPYQNRFTAIPKTVSYRPARRTPKPVVSGVVTGIVEHASPTELGAIDEMGRYRVQFMYDSVTGRGDAKASRPLRMAQPSASADRGFHVPLKPGTEVIITCVNGDPDRPIIAGAVPNPQTPSPVTSANSEKSMWTTNKNAIAIDDQNPRCKVTVNGEDHVLQIGEPNGPSWDPDRYHRQRRDIVNGGIHRGLWT